MPAQMNFECLDLLQPEILEPLQNHIDVSFVRQYVEFLSKKAGFGLKELQRSILEYDGNEIVCQTILPFYVGVLTKVIHSSSDPSEFLKRSEVLQIFQQFILPSVDSHIPTADQPTFTLKILFYELLLEMYSKQISENHWPFKLDISNMIVYPLANESTAISLRKIIEQSAILRINSSGKTFGDTNNELINQLAHVLLAADFNLGFKDSFTHTMILSKLAERFLTAKNEGSHYSEDSFLQQLLSSPKWRYSLNEEALLSFVQTLLDVCDIESTITLFEQYILPYLLESSSAISLLKMLEQQSGGRFLQGNYQLIEQICSLLNPVLLLNEKEEICKDSVRWELLDSALQILSILGDKHNFDNQKLFNRLFEISIGFSNEFLRLPACVLLTRLFKKELIDKLSEVWSANTENEQIKQIILMFALRQLFDLNVNVDEELVSDSREILLKDVVALIDYIDPEEEESLNVIKMSVQLCEVLYTDFGKNEINRKLILFTKQLESMERRKYERNAYEKNNHKCINELIDDLKNGCNIDNDECGTKD
uniref:Uncharacterized protein n=1 Tax=Meloidogyne javanica TaxID=6303 RepID=A0A915MSF4_MELJA